MKPQTTFSQQIDSISQSRNLSSPELNLSPISKFQRTTDQQGLYNDSNAERTRKTTHPEIPWFLAKPRSDSLWKMNWKVLLLNGSQTRAAVDEEPSPNVSLRVNIPGNLGVRLPRVWSLCYRYPHPLADNLVPALHAIIWTWSNHQT